MTNEASSVLMIPDYSERNPYQSQLGDALDRAGVAVSMGDVSGLAPVLREWYHNGRPDVVHIHWIHTFINTDRALISALLACRLLVELLLVRLLGTRVVWTVHNLLSHKRQHPRIELTVRQGVALLASRLIVHCDSAKTDVGRKYSLPDRVRARLRVVSHGHYRECYPNDVDEAMARKKLDLSRDARVILFFGLIRPYKNVPRLISTFREVEHDDARLLVVGNPWNESVREAVVSAAAGDERVRTVLEYVPEADIQRYMNAADVVALPFASVLTSGSALLAMSFGRPLVLPAIGCPGEVVGTAGGFQYDPDDSSGLRDALETAIGTDERLDEMGRRNRRVAEQFDWDTIAERTRAVYRLRSGSQQN